MIIGSPVAGQIYLTASGTRFYRSQRFGCTGVLAEQRLDDCLHFHRAIDIAPSDGRTGVDLRTAAAGRIIAAGELNDGAKVIAVYHGGGWVTGYAHCASFVASYGEEVAKGQHIAEMGKSGIATGIHVHFILKSSFTPGSSSAINLNKLILDDPSYPVSGISSTRGDGLWVDPWPRLEQNVTIHPKVGNDVNIRTGSSTAATVFAVSRADGRIVTPAGVDLGASASWRKWGGIVTGSSYTVNGVTSTKWEKILLGSTYYYIASLLAVRSIS